MSLLARAILRMFVVVVLLAMLLFVPAGTWRYWQGWLLLAESSIVALISVAYLHRHNPQLLARRMQTGEHVREQRLIMGWLLLIWPLAMIMPGLDQRFGWSRLVLAGVPLWLTLLSHLLVVACFGFVFWAMKVNSFAARTIQVEPGQQVVSCGPYRFVRHPMYLGVLVMYLSLPLALGSYVALPVFALFIALIVLRLLNEETVLRQQLPGYSEYCQRTPFRLVPFVW